MALLGVGPTVVALVYGERKSKHQGPNGWRQEDYGDLREQGNSVHLGEDFQDLMIAPLYVRSRFVWTESSAPSWSLLLCLCSEIIPCKDFFSADG